MIKQLMRAKPMSYQEAVAIVNDPEQTEEANQDLLQFYKETNNLSKPALLEYFAKMLAEDDTLSEVDRNNLV